MTTARQRATPDDEQVFRNLVESAFEFLERAIAEIDSATKFSTIHFAIALELFLKARLMREHWTLVVDNPDRTSRRQFLDGRAHTVTQGQAINRLRDLADVSISSAAQQAFKAVSERRNVMIHFVHGVGEPDQRKALLEAIALEQCRGWFHLEQLLSDWAEHLTWVRKRVSTTRQNMKRHNRFMKVRFEAFSEQIKAEKQNGTRFSICRGCDFKAARQGEVSSQIALLDCMVCEVKDTLFGVACSNGDCTKVLQFTAFEGLPQICTACKSAAGSDEVGEALNTEVVTKDNYFDVTPISCAACMGYHSVVRHEHVFVCTECLEVEGDYQTCGFCHEGQMGGRNLEGSYHSGCEFCDGAAGWERDE